MRQRARSRQVWGKWRKLVREQEGSGESVAAFCRERKLCAPHFFAWKKRLREAAGAKFEEVKLAVAGTGLAGATRAAGDARVEILLKNGRSLRVGPGFDAELVRALMAVVESAA
jgi:hypothetical protein